MTSRLKARALGIFAVLVGGGACGGTDAVAPTPASVAGSYTLRTINGHALPFQPLPESAVVVGDTLVLGAAGSFERTELYGDPTLGVTTPGRTAGTWSVSHDTVTLVEPVGPTAELIPVRLVVADGGLTFIGPPEIGWLVGAASGVGAVYRR